MQLTIYNSLVLPKSEFFKLPFCLLGFPAQEVTEGSQNHNFELKLRNMVHMIEHSADMPGHIIYMWRNKHNSLMILKIDMH
jgi:hypothetical protein